METAASLIAFIQVAGKIVELIIEVNQLWGEAKDLPGDLRDILEELDDYALVFEELKEQIEYDQTHNTRSNGSCMSRSFMAATKAKEILKELVEEINMTIHSKKEGLQRRLSSFKLLMKKEKIERYQKRLQRSITLLQTAISTYQIAMMRQNTEIIVGRVTDNFSEKFEYLQLNQTSMLATSAAYQTEQKQLCGSSNSKQQELCTPQRGRLPSSKQYTSSWTGHFSMSRTSAEGAWQAYLQLPSWLSQSTHIFQSYPTRSGWTFNYRVYNIVAPDSEIIARIHNGDKNGVLELFSARKASPFDKDSDGASLLYHAARSKHYDICKLLLNMGLEDTLFEVVGRDRESPLKPLVYNPEKDAMGHDWERIVTLFQTYLQDPEDMPVTRLFDFLHEWAHSDNFVFIFRTRFMPKYYTWPSRIRFEAVRLGSFHLRSCASLPKLLSEDSKVSQLDVSLSSHENFSLLHSAAISLGIRFADEAIPKRRGEFQWGTYNDGWDDFVIDIASVSESEDLHHVEAVSPWDVYKVPQWKGTPLFSLLGGTLCYLTTGTSFFHWNHVFQKTLHQWLGDLKIAGVDLLRYGTRERGFFRDHVLRGAFDSNAITSSRVLIREAMANGSYDTNVTHSLRENISENRWIPIRLVDLKVGEDITDWEILWAPEFEYMACEFWRLFEEEENTMIPGAWVED
ncbi:hypothetical protein NXS19_001161 [Fusarium pseudograminearum]|uniref:Uncharacterized protein n=1 Tax=Fusarium pseudograminearum (strain CS3096) TaxID=1028729 RepID=K3UZS0_FUSPC|nr:hypothetical protein FPSE_01441 [Fusarium pseudograminearum CS3096]EKJ78336.1 hypothetical protein FPSE_01441 [Fusarium pseudograminearum CS3096]UZP33345.1 hypothetical protein NXS19_001161 [Fusarium pseudograminearum]